MFHPDKVSYVVERKYEPDFEIKHKDGKYLLEFKGYFRDAPEAAKYTWIRKALPDSTELLFVFDNPDKPIHFKPKRTCGTKMTHAQWAEKNKFRYFSPTSFETFYNQLEK